MGVSSGRCVPARLVRGASGLCALVCDTDTDTDWTLIQTRSGLLTPEAAGVTCFKTVLPVTSTVLSEGKRKVLF